MNGQNEGVEMNEGLGIQLNRLVDGELTEGEYRDLLNGLEMQPDGWRRCALAFLEAQAWGRELNALRAEAVSPSPPPVKPRDRWSWYYTGVMALACAASFVLAFSLASRWQTGTATPNQFAGGSITPRLETLSDAPKSQFASDQRGANPSNIDSPLGKYQLVVENDSAQREAVEMPVFGADDPRAGMLLDEYATIPRDLIRALESQGNHVQRQRNWIPMPGDSKVPVYVPVDELQVTPVSGRSFQ